MNDLAAVVIAAMRANSVGKVFLAAVGALDKVQSLQSVVRAPFVAASTGNSAFGKRWHFLLLYRRPRSTGQGCLR